MSTEKTIIDAARQAKQGQQRLDQAIEHAENHATITALQQQRVSGYTEERDLMNRLLGQAQMSLSMAKFATVVSLTKAEYIKKNKLYRALKGVSAVAPDGTEIPDVGTWAGFCQLLGSSPSKMDEDIRNLHFFGEQALEQLNSVGAGYRELRRLRKLPPDARAEVLQDDVLESGDVEKLRERIEQLESRLSVREKDAEGLRKDLAAKQSVLESKVEHISKLEHQLAQRETMKHDERADELDRDLEEKILTAIGAMVAPANACKEILEWDEAPKHLRNKALSSFARLQANLEDLAERVGVPVFFYGEAGTAWQPWMGAPEAESSEAPTEPPEMPGAEWEEP